MYKQGLEVSESQNHNQKIPTWLTPFLIVLTSAVLAPFASKMASSHLAPMRAAVIETGATLLVIIVGVIALSRGNAITISSTTGPLWATAAGVLWTGYTGGVYYMFQADAPVAVSMTALRALTILVTAVIAATVLGESMSWIQIAGVEVTAIGVALVTSG